MSLGLAVLSFKTVISFPAVSQTLSTPPKINSTITWV